METNTNNFMQGASRQQVFKAAYLLDAVVKEEAVRELQSPSYKPVWNWNLEDLGKMIQAVKERGEADLVAFMVGPDGAVNEVSRVPDTEGLGKGPRMVGRMLREDEELGTPWWRPLWNRKTVCFVSELPKVEEISESDLAVHFEVFGETGSGMTNHIAKPGEFE